MLEMDVEFSFVRFEVVTAGTMKNAVFLDLAPCGLIINRRFGGTLLHLQSRRNNASEEKVLDGN
jgi:hypothetical protein